jgi:hypothetical protein
MKVSPDDPLHPQDHAARELLEAIPGCAAAAWLKQRYPAAYALLHSFYHDPHAMMASVLNELYRDGVLSWQNRDDESGCLARSEGACHFCVNQRWRLFNECPYGKTHEPPRSTRFLEKWPTGW